MAEFKRQTFLFSNGKQIKLYGTGFGITKDLEITEASAPNIFWISEGREDGKPTAIICNPYKLTAEEILEVADYCIRQWMDLKDSVRMHGVDSPRVFNRENIRPADEGKPEPTLSKKGNKSGFEKQKVASNGEGPAGSRDDKAQVTCKEK